MDVVIYCHDGSASIIDELELKTIVLKYAGNVCEQDKVCPDNLVTNSVGTAVLKYVIQLLCASLDHLNKGSNVLRNRVILGKRIEGGLSVEAVNTSIEFPLGLILRMERLWVIEREQLQYSHTLLVVITIAINVDRHQLLGEGILSLERDLGGRNT